MKSYITTIVLLLFLAGWVRGQELLKLQDAIAIGLAHNYDIIISKNSAREAGNDASPGNAGMLPVVDIHGSYLVGLNNAKVNVLTGNSLDVTSARSDLITAGLGINWRLFDGLKMFITFDKLKKLEEISDLSAKITIENTIARIMAGYFEVIRQKHVLNVLTEQVGISEFRRDLARMQFETGTGSEMEYLKARVQLNADVANLSNQTTLAKNAKTALNDLLAREVNTEFSVPDTLTPGALLNYDTLRVAMKKSNRNLILAMRNKQVSEMEVRSAIADQWPTLDFYAAYTYYRNETQANFIQYNRNYGPSLGLTLSMKLFDGLNLQRIKLNTVISAETSDIEIKKLENRLESLLARIYNDYQNQTEMIGFEKENLQLATRSMDIAKTSYAIGSISSLQLRDVQDDLLDARTRLITAFFRVKLTETELLLLTGALLQAQ